MELCDRVNNVNNVIIPSAIRLKCASYVGSQKLSSLQLPVAIEAWARFNGKYAYKTPCVKYFSTSLESQATFQGKSFRMPYNATLKCDILLALGLQRSDFKVKS